MNLTRFREEISSRLQKKPGLHGAFIAFFCFLAVDFAIIYIAGFGGIFFENGKSKLGVVSFLAANAALILSFSLFFKPIELPGQAKNRYFALLLTIGLACLAIAWFAFKGYSWSGDEYVYQFQADTLRAFHLWNPPPPLGQAQSITYIWIKDGKWVAQYSPGWPLLLALAGGSLPTGRLANCLFTVAIAFVIYKLVKRRGTTEAAWLAAAFFGLSIFALLNGASLFSHTSAAALGGLAILASTHALKDGRARWIALAGASIGLLCITRSVTAVVYVIPIIIQQLGTPGWFRRGLIAALAGAPFLAGLLIYQYEITGDPLMPVYWYGGRTVDHLYFDWPSIKTAIGHAVMNQPELALFVSPFFLVIWGWSFLYLARSRRLAASDFVLPLGMFIFLFYPLHAGERWGPRYYFDFWPMALVTIGAALGQMTLAEDVHKTSSLTANLFRQMVVVSVIGAAATSVVVPFRIRDAMIDRFDVFELAKAMKLQNAVVCAGARYNPRLPDIGTFGLAQNGINVGRAGPAISNPVLYINCRATTFDAVKAAYPDRTLWRYVRPAGDAKGSLVPVDAGTWPEPYPN